LSAGARLLYWGDAPTVCTGFGVVARHVLAALFDAGYEIDCLGINAVPDFPDRNRFPYDIIAAGTLPQDPLGHRALARLVGSRPYDLLFVQNDLHVLQPAAAYLRAMQGRGARLPAIICYYPVDCAVRADLTGMLQLADVTVICTAFGQRETEKTLPTRVPQIIPHGVDSRAFRPLDDRSAARRRFRQPRNIPEDALLVCSVAANSVRKDLARTIAAFARWRASQPTASPLVLYLHTIPLDNGLDLHHAVAASGLQVGRDVIFPDSYHPVQGISDEALNDLYNAADVYFTTTLGEGWGLPVTEAMAAGLPVVAPRHSSLQEIAGEGRAVLYECAERIWVDNSGYRPLGLMEDIVTALGRAAALPEIERRRMTAAARAFAVSLDWSVVAPRWIPIAAALHAARNDPRAGARPHAVGDATAAVGHES
jgi:glycosyltransferase involved in cell wall biosynthesis